MGLDDVCGPIESIRDIGFLPGAAWRKNFIPFDALEGRTISLGHIEHGILRKRFQEPRIHFAINCASKSCPQLRREPYRATHLHTQLEDAARMFLRDTTKNRFDASKRVLRLSAIFDWFEDDFETTAVDVKTYVLRYLPERTSQDAAHKSVDVEYLDYDWSLNEAGPR